MENQGKRIVQLIRYTKIGQTHGITREIEAQTKDEAIDEIKDELTEQGMAKVHEEVERGTKYELVDSFYHPEDIDTEEDTEE